MCPGCDPPGSPVVPRRTVLDRPDWTDARIRTSIPGTAPARHRAGPP
jgi:hypothetical protein